MTDEEFTALEKRNEEVLAMIEEQRKQFGTELWWREDAIGIMAAKDCAVAIEEIKRLRISAPGAFPIPASQEHFDDETSDRRAESRNE